MGLVTYAEQSGVTLDTQRIPVLTKGIQVLVDTSEDIEPGTALAITGNNTAVAASILRSNSVTACSAIVLIDSGATFTDDYEGKIVQKTQGGGKSQAIILRMVSATELLLDRAIDFTNADDYSIFANTLAKPREDAESVAIGVVREKIEKGSADTAVNASYIYNGELRNRAITDYNENKAGGAGLEEGYVSDSLANVKGLQFEDRKFLL